MSDIKTPETHPDHHTVGHHFAGYSQKHEKAQVYFCDSYDPDIGYWMTNIYDPSERKNVSERAIGRTFHECYREETLWNCYAWNKLYPLAEAANTPSAQQ